MKKLNIRFKEMELIEFLVEIQSSYNEELLQFESETSLGISYQGTAKITYIVKKNDLFRKKNKVKDIFRRERLLVKKYTRLRNHFMFIRYTNIDLEEAAFVDLKEFECKDLDKLNKDLMKVVSDIFVEVKEETLNKFKADVAQW